MPTSRRAQRNRGDGATNGLYIPQIPEERLGLATVGGSVETILRGHQAGRATIRRQTGTIKPHHLCVLFCVPREAYTLWGAMGREYGEEAACCHTLRTRDSLWHTSQSLTDLDFNPDFATPELRDYGHVISAQCLWHFSKCCGSHCFLLVISNLAKRSLGESPTLTLLASGRSSSSFPP